MSAKKAESSANKANHKSSPSLVGVPASTRFFVIDHESGWIACPAGNFRGNLFYDKGADSYSAICFIPPDNLAAVSKGFRTPEDSPDDGDGNLKSEFLSLAYMRLFWRFEKLSEQNSNLFDRNVFLKYRRKAVDAMMKEQQVKSGKPISQRARENAATIYGTHGGFKKHFGLIMHSVWERQDAADVLSRFAQWTRAIDRVLSNPPDPDDNRFLRAVEIAAARCAGVPTSKSVETEFDRHRSANQIGGGSTYRTIKKRLGFNWLPSSAAGRPSVVRNRVRKSPT